jgi:putative transposase
VDADGRVDEQGLRWGVESICTQLADMGAKIAPPTYYEQRSRTPSKRQLPDEHLRSKITVAHASNYGVFGAREIWLTLNRQRTDGEATIARCTVEPLMAELGLAGAIRGKVKRITISNPRTPNPLDVMNRNFRRPAPDRLWAADCTYWESRG